jgi:DNA-binding PadR family transcriptional regulator
MSRSLGEFEQLLLYAVLRLGRDAYGARVRQEIEACTGKSVSAGAVYTGLDRLQARGLVSSRLGEATSRRGGRRKKYWALEPLGAESLKSTQENLSRMAEGVLDRLDDLVSRPGDLPKDG